MSRNFTAASSQYLEYSGAVIASLPITMACWARVPSSATFRTALCLMTNGSESNRIWVVISDTATINAWSNDGGFTNSATSATLAANTWGHVGGVFASTTSRTAYLNGVAGTTDTTSNSPSGWNRTRIGRQTASNPFYMNGDIAEAAWWNVALTTAEMAQLAAGYSPLFIRPDSLMAYAPLIGQTSPEIELIGGQAFTLTSAPTTSAHPRVFMPNANRARFLGAAAAAAQGGYRLIGAPRRLVSRGGLVA